MWSCALGSMDLDPGVWGNKSSLLGIASALPGIAVPPAWCILPDSIRPAGRKQLKESIDSWLKLYRPQTVIVRSSEHGEDSLDDSRAGLSITITDCAPDAVFLVDTVYRMTSKALASVMVQAQVSGQWSGVAMGVGNRFTFEAARAPRAVTDGRTVEVRGDVSGESTRCQGASAVEFPTTDVCNALEYSLSRLDDALGLDRDLDIEWVWSDGALYLVQVRPVTRRLWI
ncbi:hypothetical protein ABH924_004324 [Arthrobacter sp. GAS37]